MEHYRRTLQTDCEQLLSSYQDINSVRYEDFTSVWRRLHFCSIFYGGLEPNESRVFTRLALSVASPYFFPPYTFQIRVGALYLLYGLYNTQLITPKEKIHLALKDWDDLMRFQQDAVKAQHYDVVFILRKLLSEKAFYFTAMPNPLVFNVKKKKCKDKSLQLRETFVNRPSGPQELISTDLLEEITNVHEHYEKLKKVISPEPDKPELSLAKQNLVPKLRNAVVTFYNWQQNQTEFDIQSSEADRDAGEGPSSQDESSRRAQLLQSIKSKSYGQAVEASKSRRHRQVEVTSADIKTELTENMSEYKRKALSLKKRTQSRFMSQENPDKEMERVTRLWRLTTVEDEKTEEKPKRRFDWNPEKSTHKH